MLSSICSVMAVVFMTISFTLALLLSGAVALAFLLAYLMDVRDNRRRAARDRRHYEDYKEEMRQLRAWQDELVAFAKSLQPNELRLFEKFLTGHRHFRSISQKRSITFLPQLSIETFAEDFYARRNLKTRLRMLSMYNVIQDVIVEFKEHLARYRVRRECTTQVLSLSLPLDCCNVVLDLLD
jgi:hypothetical protein